MKIVFIGDIHGRGSWEKIINSEQDSDKFVIMGDYFDAYESNITPRMQIDNFSEILDYKKNNLDDIVLLFGNHDFHYLKNVRERYSRYINSHNIEISKLITEALDNNYLKLAFSFDNTLVTHAGVTKTWLKRYLGAGPSVDVTILTEALNEILKTSPEFLYFENGMYSSYTGDDIQQSPIWVRPISLLRDAPYNINQIVGHTRVKNIHGFPKKDISIWLIDALEINQYLVFDNGEYIIKELKQ